MGACRTAATRGARPQGRGASKGTCVAPPASQPSSRHVSRLCGCEHGAGIGGGPLGDGIKAQAVESMVQGGHVQACLGGGLVEYGGKRSIGEVHEVGLRIHMEAA